MNKETMFLCKYCKMNKENNFYFANKIYNPCSLPRRGQNTQKLL
jgi:hypothetical protein